MIQPKLLSDFNISPMPWYVHTNNNKYYITSDGPAGHSTVAIFDREQDLRYFMYLHSIGRYNTIEAEAKHEIIRIVDLENNDAISLDYIKCIIPMFIFSISLMYLNVNPIIISLGISGLLIPMFVIQKYNYNKKIYKSVIDVYKKYE